MGAVPAYDLALQIISTDSQHLKAQLGVLRAGIEEKETKYRALEKEAATLPEEERSRRKEELDRLDDEIEEMMIKANVVEIQSEVNIPEVRWNVNNAMGTRLVPSILDHTELYEANMSILSHRHLVEQKWRKDGDLDLLVGNSWSLKGSINQKFRRWNVSIKCTSCQMHYQRFDLALTFMLLQGQLPLFSLSRRKCKYKSSLALS